MLTLTEAKTICRFDQQLKLAEELGMIDWIKYLKRDTYLDEKLQVFSLLNLDKLPNQKNIRLRDRTRTYGIAVQTL